MKRFVIFMIISLSCVAVAGAQSLRVLSLFGSTFKENPNATEIVIKGGDIREYGLDVFMSLTVTADGDKKIVADAVAADAPKAAEKEVTYAGGHLAYGFYTFPPLAHVNRYVFYFNNEKKAVVMYMSGSASSSKIKKMIKK